MTNIHLGKKAVAVVIGATVVLGGAGAAAWAETSSASAVSTPTTPVAPAATPAVTPGAGTRARVRAGALLGRIDHGVVEVKDASGAWITVDYDRGKLASVSGNALTLARPDGQSVTLTVTPTTTFRGVTSEAGLVVGRPTIIVSNPDGSARIVAQGTGARGGAGADTTPTTVPPVD